MVPVRNLGLIVLTLGFSNLPIALAQDSKESKEEILSRLIEDRRDQTNLKHISERTFLHEPTGVAYTIPEGWKEMPPQRLARNIDKRISTILGIEDRPHDVLASLYWIQLNPTQKLTEYVRDTPSTDTGEYGEEYETLKAVYGKDRVTVPARIKQGPFDVYRIHISGGPERGEKYDGVLFLFDVSRDGKQWLIKARVSFPKADRTTNEPFAMAVLQGYSNMPEKIDSGKK